MQTLRRTSLLIVILLAAVTACVMPTVSWTDPSLQATLQALTIEAAIEDAAGHDQTARLCQMKHPWCLRSPPGDSYAVPDPEPQ
jgi:hypothetical protein